MAALIAQAAEEAEPFEVVSMESRGVALILGRDEVALDAARDLLDNLDITVLVTPGAEITPPRRNAFPVLQGRISRAIGHLGEFELTVDAYASPSPSSRGKLVFGGTRNGAVSRCDLVIDLTGGKPLFPAGELRPGYFRADPADPVAVAKLVVKAQQMVGTFDKPRFINFAPDLCAHSRNQQTGCTRCPRSLPRRRHRARRRQRGDRSQYLRRLWPVCRRLSHRRGSLRASDGGEPRPAHPRGLACMV